MQYSDNIMNCEIQTEWSSTSKHNMGKLDLSPILETQPNQASRNLLVVILQEPNEISAYTYFLQTW